MNPFANKKPTNVEKSQDVIGGYVVHDSDIYAAEIKMAYLGKSSGGSDSMTFSFDLGNGKLFEPTIYFTNKATGEMTYEVKDKETKKVVMKDGKPVLRYIPGAEVVNHICMVAAGCEFTELPGEDFEQKMVNIYDPDQKKKVPKSVTVITSLLDKQVGLAISKTLENKSVKSGNEYVATADTREGNEIKKVFDVATKLTVTEMQNEAAATFWDAWLKKNLGQVEDKRTVKGDTGGQSGRPARVAQDGPPMSGGADAPRSSLFNKK